MALTGKEGNRRMSDLLSLFPFLWKSREKNTWSPRCLVKDGSCAEDSSIKNTRDKLESMHTPVGSANLGDEPFTK